MHLSKFAPPTGSAILERERLLGKLASWGEKRLVLVSGPAGQGKTTLAAAYVRSLGAPFAWITLDEADREPGTFLESLGKAIRTCHPGGPESFSSVPFDRYPAKAAFRAITSWARNAFSGIKNGLIVIDDFRSPTADCPLSRTLDVLIAVAPPTIRFIILSRARPALDVSRLRAQRAVSELSGEDLRFTNTEAADLFRTVFGMPVSIEDAARLNQLTEGWAAGLVLIHEYMVSAQVPLARLPLPGGGNLGYRENVFDYLAHEVFSHLPSDLQDFLLRTSIVEHLSLPLAELLTGLPAGPSDKQGTVGSMVSELIRRNLFVSTIDAGEPVVRYHALFREFLMKQLLVSTAPSTVYRLYDAAACHMLRSENTIPAIELYLGSGQFEKAVPLIERSGRELMARGRTHTLTRLLDALPPLQQDQPWLLFFRAVSLRFSDPRSALGFHERAYVSFRSSGNREGQMLTLCGIIEACFHSGGDFRRMEQAAIRARKLVHMRKRITRATRARLLHSLGIAWFFTGRLDRAIEALREAMQQFRATGDTFHEVSCAVYLAPSALYRGDFVLARETVRRGFEVQRSIPEDPGGEAALHLAQAMVFLFSGDIVAAGAAVADCRRLVRDNSLESIDLLLLNIGGWVAFAAGDLRAAEVQLTECLGKTERSGSRFFGSIAAHFLTMVYLFQRRLDRAKLMADRSLALPASEQSGLFRGIYLIMSGAVLHEMGTSRQARSVLLEAVKLLRKAGAIQQEVNARLMLVRVLSAKGDAAARSTHLKEAFTLGRERGFSYYAPFTGEQIIQLADEAIARGHCVDYCRSLRSRATGPGMLPPLRVFCLGGFRVEKNGMAIPDVEWKSRRAKTLIKLLVVHGDGALSRDTAIDILWPNAPAERHSALMSSLLHRLRTVLDPPERAGRTGSCITQNGDVLEIDQKKVWSDVNAFREKAQHARRLRAAGEDRRVVLTACEKALEQYGGELLPTDLFDDWITPERECLKRLHSEMLDMAAEISEAVGDQDRSRVLYERMFSLDPCHDQACRWLMTRHAAEGHRHKAVRVYERHELAVRRELDVEPDQRTRKVYRSIIGG